MWKSYNVLPFVLLQAAPSFPSSFPHLFSGKDNLRCLIPCAIDQVDSSHGLLLFFSLYTHLNLINSYETHCASQMRYLDLEV